MKSDFAAWMCASFALAISPMLASAEDLPEIMVTAQKKEQRLADVGISITAIDATELRQNNVKLAEDIVKLVPSLQFNEFTPGAVVFNIRGVSQNDFGDQQEPPVAVYYDDSYASSLNLSSFPVFDLARVEVLRGPQGTLFGRNATGGAIRYISNKPTRDFESSVTLTAGRFKQFDLEGVLSGPVSDSLQGRLAVVRASNEGYFENLYDGSRRGGQDNYAIRGQLAGQSGDNLQALLTVRYARNQHENNAGPFSWVADYASPESNYLGAPATPATPSPFGTCNGCDIVGYSNYALNPFAGGDPWKLNTNRPADFDRTLRGASLKLDGKVGGFDLVSISDYLQMSKTDLEDGDAGPITSFNTDLRSNISQFTEEARISARHGRHDWVAGAFYMHINGDYSFEGNFASYGDYVTNGAFTQTTSSIAAFAQDEIALTGQLSLIAGARYWRDKREIDFNLIDNFGSLFQFASTTFPGLADRTFNGWSGKLEVDWKPVEDTLIYLSWNRGTKSGGFTTQFFPPADSSPDYIQSYAAGLTYNPEILTAVELGTKTRLLNGKLSLSADVFYYDYKDYQAYVLYGPNVTIKNLNAREHGLEAEAAFHPVTGLTFSAGLSGLNSRVNDVPLPDGTFATRDLPQAPKWSGHLTARYDRSLSNGGTLGFNWNTTFTGKSCFSVLCGPIDVERGRAVSDARISYTSANDWELAVFVRNVTNRIYRVFNSDTNFIGVAESVYAPPRWYGLTATVRFGKTQ